MASLMERRIADLAARIRLARENGDRYVLLLGAGASISSNVPTTETIISDLLKRYGRMYADRGDELDQFDALWNDADDELRRQYLQPYLEQTPSEGYRLLADLVNRGFFKLIVSFNFDVLPQLAIEATGKRLLELVGGYDPVDKIEEQIDADRYDASIFQLHGSLRRPSQLQFSIDEIFSYDDPTTEILKELTSQNVIVCGYAFQDLNVIKSFADFGRALWWVNPSDPPRAFKHVQGRRSSSDCTIVGEDGMFDTFLRHLHKQLTQKPEAPARRATERNPFKFLASHRESDRRSLYYRARAIRRLYDAIATKTARNIHLSGKRMAGKTSLIRAGLLPKLRGTDFLPIYIRRCGREIDKTLPEKIQRISKVTLSGSTIDETLAELCKSHPDKHVVLILDQFERTITALGERPAAEAREILDSLLIEPVENLTVIPVFTSEVLLGDMLYLAVANENSYIQPNMYQDLKPLTKHQVGRIVRLKARRSPVEIPPEILSQLIDQYDHKQLTLAHIETICHLLTGQIDLYHEIRARDLAAGSQLVTALDRALVEHEILSYLEDLPIPEEQNLLRNVLLAASNPSRQTIAEYLKNNFRAVHRDDQADSTTNLM